MDKKVYLLLKTHNVTGLKYLCRHITKDENTCYTYKGSGLYWKRHIKKYGNDCQTEILAKCDTIEEAKLLGSEFSEKWKIVESVEFANLVPENGQGGSEVSKYRKTHGNRFGYDIQPNRFFGESNPSKLPEVRKKISEKLKGRPIEWKDKISKAKKGKPSPNKGKPNPYAKTNHMNAISPISCQYCGKKSTNAVMKKWHFEKCKNKTENDK